MSWRTGETTCGPRWYGWSNHDWERIWWMGSTVVKRCRCKSLTQFISRDYWPIFQDEYNLLKELSPLSSPTSIAFAYGTLLSPILKLFSSTLSLLVVLIKKSLQKYNFLVLSAYESLLSLQSDWDDVLSRRGSDYPDGKNELKDGLQSLRAICLRSFPEFLADLKMGSMSKGSDTSVRLTDFTKAVSLFYHYAPEFLILFHRP